METIEIVKEEIKQTTKGDDYVNVKLSDGRYLNLFFENFQAYEGLGHYEAEIERDPNKPKFWNVKKATLKPITMALDSIPAPKPISKVHNVTTPSSNQIDTARNILLQVCIKSAAEVFHGKGTEIDTHNAFVEEMVVRMASKMLSWAEKNNRSLEDVPF